jgi:hypothetical protein
LFSSLSMIGGRLQRKEKLEIDINQINCLTAPKFHPKFSTQIFRTKKFIEEFLSRIIT